MELNTTKEVFKKMDRDDQLWTLLETTSTNFDAHDVRIRKLEKGKWYQAGWNSVLAMLSGFVAGLTGGRM